MKKFLVLGLACLFVLGVSGCAQLHDGLTAAENFLKNPPTTVINALKLGLDFVLGIVNVFLHGALGGLLPL